MFGTLEEIELENILREVSVIAAGVKNKSSYGSHLVTVRRSEMMERARKAKSRLEAVLEHVRANKACTGLATPSAMDEGLAQNANQ